VRKTCLRIVFRSPTLSCYTLTTELPWDFLRELPPDYLHHLPNFVKKNKDKLTGKPITLDEFKKMVFPKILRKDVEFEHAVLNYDKLHVADAATQSLDDFFKEASGMSDEALKNWMDACGTDTAKDIAFTLLTRDIKTASSSEQAEMKKAIDAEPKRILDFGKEEK